MSHSTCQRILIAATIATFTALAAPPPKVVAPVTTAMPATPAPETSGSPPALSPVSSPASVSRRPAPYFAVPHREGEERLEAWARQQETLRKLLDESRRLQKENESLLTGNP